MEQHDYRHESVLLNESVEALNIKSDGVYVDVTFGGGGHSRAIMERLGVSGRLISFDHDKDAWLNAIDDKRFTLVKENFQYLSYFLDYLGVDRVDGLLADLGVSSHHFDTAERGFSTRFDGPLDMRMDSRLSLTAAEVLNTYSEQLLHRMFERYGQVRNAKTLASEIVKLRSVAPLQSIEGFKAGIADLVRGKQNRYYAQVFQAVRMEVNQELEVLERLMEDALPYMSEGGRMAIITFHSLEDKAVKRFYKNGGVASVEVDEFGRRRGEKQLKEIVNKVPSDLELRNNNRSRSARLRVAEKI